MPASASGGSVSSGSATPTVIVDLEFGLELTITDSAETVDFGLTLQIAAQQDAEFGLQLTLLDPDVLGGLDGAGGWAAAPDGKWQATLLLGGVDRSAELMGSITVRRAANAATTAEFEFAPASPLAPMALVGQPVRIAFAQRGPGDVAINAQTMFVGVVDQPTLDLPNQTIKCMCTDLLQEVISNTPREWVDANVGGRYSEDVSGVPEDTWQYCLERLASVPKSIALDPIGNPRVFAWRDTASAIRVTEDDFLEGYPQIELPHREEMRTRVVCNVEYRYQALRNRGIVSRWSQSASFFIFGPNGSGGPLHWLTTDMVEGAFQSLQSWELARLVIEHPQARSYPAGDGLYTILPEHAPSLAVGWNARLRARWHQTRTEQLTLTVVAPNLEELLGQPVSEEIGATVSAPDPDVEWHSSRSTVPKFGSAGVHAMDPDTIPAGLVGDTVYPYEPMHDGDTARDQFEAAAMTLLDQARIKLWSASRSGRCRVGIPCRPDIWLGRRLEVDDPGLHAEGDIVGVIHTLDADSGEATTEIEAAIGLPGNEDSAAPTWILPAVTYPESIPANAPLPSALSGSHGYYIGGLASSPPFDEDTMIGVITNVDTNAVFISEADQAARNWYPLQLTVKTPEIPAADRDPIELPATADYAWDVPTDLLDLL